MYRSLRILRLMHIFTYITSFVLCAMIIFQNSITIYIFTGMVITYISLIIMMLFRCFIQDRNKNNTVEQNVNMNKDNVISFENIVKMRNKNLDNKK